MSIPVTSLFTSPDRSISVTSLFTSPMSFFTSPEKRTATDSSWTPIPSACFKERGMPRMVVLSLTDRCAEKFKSPTHGSYEKPRKTGGKRGFSMTVASEELKSLCAAVSSLKRYRGQPDPMVGWADKQSVDHRSGEDRDPVRDPGSGCPRAKQHTTRPRGVQ